jgi:hypothetical protein
MLERLPHCQQPNQLMVNAVMRNVVFPRKQQAVRIGDLGLESSARVRLTLCRAKVSYDAAVVQLQDRRQLYSYVVVYDSTPAADEDDNKEPRELGTTKPTQSAQLLRLETYTYNYHFDPRLLLISNNDVDVQRNSSSNKA